MYSSNSGHGNNIDITNPYGMAARDPYLQPQNFQAPQWGSDQGVAPHWPQQLPQFPDNPAISVVQPQPAHLQPQVAVDPQIQQQMQRPDWPVRPLLPVIPPNNGNPSKVDSLQPIKTDAVGSAKGAAASAADGQKQVQKETGDDTDSVEEKESEYDDDEKPTEPPKKKLRKHKKLENKDKSKKTKDHADKTNVHEPTTHEEMARIRSDEVDIEFVDHDGAADRPGGAVLSLTLGNFLFFFTSFIFFLCILKNVV